MTRDYSKFFSQNTNSAVSRLEALGWQDYFAQQISAEELGVMPPVRVVEVNRSGLHVIGNNVEETVPPRQDATVGDWLLYDRALPHTSRLLDRISLVKRRAPGSDRQAQLIAANIDTVFIVSSCNREFNLARLERYIAMVFEAEITPVIVLTKADLAEDPQNFIDQARAISELVPVLVLDSRGDEPAEKMAQWCKPGKTVAFLGSSGVGKSTLTNALAGTQAIETRAIREDDAKGRHTTTRRQLYFMPTGCLVLDTPGMRELQLIDAASGIGDVFADLHELSTQCRFRDCKHTTEPGCGLLEALEKGEIDAERLGRWRKLVLEEVFNSASMAERRVNDKVFSQMVRRTKSHKRKKK